MTRNELLTAKLRPAPVSSVYLHRGMGTWRGKAISGVDDSGSITREQANSNRCALVFDDAPGRCGPRSLATPCQAQDGGSGFESA